MATTKRRRPGTGSVDQLPSERWRVRVRDMEGVQRTLAGTFATEAEARKALAAALAVLVADHQGARSTKANPTVSAWARSWCEARESGGVRGASREKSVARARLDGTDLGAMLVRDVGRGDVVRWLAAVRASHATVSAKGARGARAEGARTLSRQTVSHALHVLRGALHAARDRGLIAHDPTDGVKVTRQAREVEPWTWLTADEVRAVEMCEAIPVRERAIYTVAIYTGLRQGELWALAWDDVRLDGVPELTVRRSHGSSTKTGKIRRVPLLPAAVRVLEAVPKAERVGLVFPRDGGKRRLPGGDARWSPQARYVRTDGVASPVCGYRERAGIVRRVRFHDLRHTCASHLLQGTWAPTLTLPEVAQWLGHSSVTMTERYAHLCPDRLAARVARSSQVMQPPRDSDRDSRVSHDLRKVRARRDSNPQPSDPKSDGGSLKTPCIQQVPAARDSRMTHGAAERVLRMIAEGLQVETGDVRALVVEAIGAGVDPQTVARAMVAAGEGRARAVVELAAAVVAVGEGATAVEHVS